MTSFRFLVLSVLLFFSLRCSHTEISNTRVLNNLESGQDCSRQLSALSGKKTKDIKEDGKKPSELKSAKILPPAEVKTLEPLEPQNYENFAKEKILTVTTYNVLNLKQMVGRYEPDINTGKRVKTKPEKEKSQSQIDGVAEAIKELNPDILFLQEVEGEASLANFAEHDLQSQWRPLLINGNDSRGIHIGVLVKKTIPLKFEYVSHRDEPFSSESHPDLKRVFSRDFPVLIARSPKGGEPLFILAGVHGKSKRSENNQDPESREIRTAQAERMVEIIKYYQQKYPKTPILIMGDFNAEVHSEPEYEALRSFNLKDALDLTPNALPVGDPGRITHTFHPNGGSTKASQLDSILLVPPHENIVLKAGVFRYKNEDGSIKPIPKTYAEREKNPSDHYPLWTELDLQKIINRN